MKNTLNSFFNNVFMHIFMIFYKKFILEKKVYLEIGYLMLRYLGR